MDMSHMSLKIKIPFDPQNSTKQERVNSTHATTGKSQFIQLPVRNTTLLDPLTLALSTCQVDSTAVEAITKYKHDKIQTGTSVAPNNEPDKTSLFSFHE